MADVKDFAVDFLNYANGVDGEDGLCFWKREGELREGKLCWFFWSRGEQNQLQVDFKSVLEGLPLRNYRLLVQLWAPVTEADQKWLVCRHNPFALYGLHRGLTEYRLLSQQLKLGVSGGNEDMLGLPGRVFRGRLLESRPSIDQYSSKEWPRLDEVVECGVQSCLGLPLFDEGGDCVGVMEMTSSSKLSNWITELSSLSHHFTAPMTCLTNLIEQLSLIEPNFLVQPHIEGVKKPEHEFASKNRKPSVILTLDYIQRCKGMKQLEAMNFLEVSKSTFQTNLKNLKLPKWSVCKDDPSLFIGSIAQPSKGKNPTMKSSHGKKSAPQKEIIIKAKGPDDYVIRFQMSYPVTFVALELKISMRMEINVGAFLMKYEDGVPEKIRITNDEDVRLWIETCKVLEKGEPVVFVVPNPNSIYFK